MLTNAQKQILAECVLSQKHRVSLNINGVELELTKLPAIKGGIMPKLVAVVTKELLPILKNAFLAIADEKEILKTDIKDFLKSDNADLLIKSIEQLDPESISFIYEIIGEVVTYPNERKALDIDEFISKYPNAYFVLLVEFIKIQVMPLFMIAPKAEEGQMKIIG